MKILFSSRERDAASTIFYEGGFSHCKDIVLYDHEFSDQYDVALFMTYKRDLEELKSLKSRFPAIKTAIIDPRGRWVEDYLPYADFLMVDSLEMKDFWAFTQKPIFEYAEYPDIERIARIHEPKEKIVIGYHGNKVHLESMYDRITPALTQIGRKYNVEFWVMYNIEALGKWDSNCPGNMKVKHIQWSQENYHEQLAKVDIGINPCFMPVDCSSRKKRAFFRRNKPDNRFNESADDYILRFKMPSNPGRIIVWGLLGIPVVSDFFPSAGQCIRDGESGFLACSTGGWYCALEKLIRDWRLRQQCADQLQETVTRRYSFEAQNAALLSFLSNRDKS